MPRQAAEKSRMSPVLQTGGDVTGKIGGKTWSVKAGNYEMGDGNFQSERRSRAIDTACPSNKNSVNKILAFIKKNMYCK